MLDAFFPLVPSESVVILAGALAGVGRPQRLPRHPRRLGGRRGRRQHLLRDRQVGRRAHGEAAVPEREGAAGASTGPSGSSRNAGATSSSWRGSSRSAARPSRSRPATRRGCRGTGSSATTSLAGGIWATYATMLGYIGGKQFEEQPWKGVLVGLGIAFSVAFAIESSAVPGQEGAAGAVRPIPSEDPRHGCERVPRLGAPALAPGATGERVEIRDAGPCGTCSAHCGRRSSSTPPIVRMATAPARSSSTAPRTLPARPRPWARGSSTSRPTSSSTAARERRTSRPTRRRPARTTGVRRPRRRTRVAAPRPAPCSSGRRSSSAGPGHAPSKHELAARNPEATFFEDEIRSPVQVGDLAARCSSSQPSSSPGAQRRRSGRRLARRPRRARHRPDGPPRAGAAGRPLDCALDSSRARALLRDGLRGVREVSVRSELDEQDDSRRQARARTVSTRARSRSPPSARPAPRLAGLPRSPMKARSICWSTVAGPLAEVVAGASGASVLSGGGARHAVDRQLVEPLVLDVLQFCSPRSKTPTPSGRS